MGTTLTTRLLPLALERLGSKEPFIVLDAGVGVAESVRFFNQFRSRVYCLDLVGEPQDTVGAALEHIPVDERFDVCFLWESLNFLDEARLRLLGEALQPFIHEETCVHLFAAYSASASLQGQRYGVMGRNLLAIKSDVPTQTPHPHSQAEIALAWPQFTVERAMLLAENRQELLLMRGGRRQPSPPISNNRGA